jgi:hypothetical protein
MYKAIDARDSSEVVIIDPKWEASGVRIAKLQTWLAPACRIEKCLHGENICCHIRYSRIEYGP